MLVRIMSLIRQQRILAADFGLSPNGTPTLCQQWLPVGPVTMRCILLTVCTCAFAGKHLLGLVPEARVPVLPNC